jgi:hypothetical protein
MSAEHREDDIDRDVERELLRLLTEAEASHKPAEVKLAGRRYHLVPVDDIRPTEDPFKDHDPERALAAISAAAGALEGLDVDAFLEEIMESREQDTPDHKY